MDRARDAEYTRRLPAGSRSELEYREGVFDKQVLFNESWHSYAVRTGMDAHTADEEHVKWCTETWDDFLARKIEQHKVLSHNAAVSEQQARHALAKNALCAARSDAVIEQMARLQVSACAQKISSRHHLYADFTEYQQIKFYRERRMLAADEEMIRTKIIEWYGSITEHLFCAKQCDLDIYVLMQTERERREAEERVRLENEKARAAAEMRMMEEERKLAEAEEARRRKEAAEAEKRLERKRKEDERRAKARADRERKRVSCIPSEEQHSAALEPAPLVEGLPDPVEVTTSSSSPLIAALACQQLEGENLASLLRSITKMLSSCGDNCYVMHIRRNPGVSTVICQNGVFLGDSVAEQAPLLSMTMSSEECVSVSSPRLHCSMCVDSTEDYIASCVECIGDVRSDSRCHPFRNGASKEMETLALFPIQVRGLNHRPFVIALCRSGCNALSEDEVTLVGKITFELCYRLSCELQRVHTARLCQQCVEWISACTGCQNVYISTRGTATDVLRYVAATPSQQFLLHRSHSLVEEKEGGRGISFAAMKATVVEGKTQIFCYSDVALQNEGPFPSHRVRFMSGDEEGKQGPLLLAPITGVREGNGVSLGVVFADYIGVPKKQFSPVDQDIIRSSVQLLANILLGNEPLVEEVHLKVEEHLPTDGPSPVTFLKLLWHEALRQLQQITSGQLLELGKYLHPPPIIPVVVQGTLLLALGCKPKSIEAWEDARKKISKQLLAKMLAFDPTDVKKRKRAYFIRARKSLKGCTARDVFEKGSFPTMCFFTWVFTAILLRKHTETMMRKQGSQGERLLFECDSDCSMVSEVDDESDTVESTTFDDMPEECM